MVQRVVIHSRCTESGAIIERPNFYPYMTAAQNLMLVCKIKGISTDAIDEKLKAVHLYEEETTNSVHSLWE